MTSTDTDLGAKANRHLWGHFARHGADITPPIIARGEGVREAKAHSCCVVEGHCLDCQ